jgi:hypothetical protein
VERRNQLARLRSPRVPLGSAPYSAAGVAAAVPRVACRRSSTTSVGPRLCVTITGLDIAMASRIVVTPAWKSRSSNGTTTMLDRAYTERNPA